jgi:hypothetical protein
MKIAKQKKIKRKTFLQMLAGLIAIPVTAKAIEPIQETKDDLPPNYEWTDMTYAVYPLAYQGALQNYYVEKVIVSKEDKRIFHTVEQAWEYYNNHG